MLGKLHRNAKEIAPASDSRCFERAMSTMRLALGYKTGLPKKWQPTQTIGVLGIAMRLSSTFPKHEVVLCLWPEDYEKLMWHFPHRKNPLIIPHPFELVNKCQDDYLWAFNYRNNDDTDGHLVVGLPWDDGGNCDIKFGFVLGVKIK